MVPNTSTMIMTPPKIDLPEAEVSSAAPQEATRSPALPATDLARLPRFLSFLLPYVDRGYGPIYHWLMLTQIAKLGTKQLALVADDEYFKHPVEWGRKVTHCDFPLQLPSREAFDEMLKFSIPREVFDELDQRSRSQLDAFRILFTEDYPPLRRALVEIIGDLTRRMSLEAILTWCNIPSLKHAAAEFNLPIIYNELGPFRPPLYHHTIYFDFNGVNGGTSAAPEMIRFCKEAREWSGFQLLELSEIRALLARTRHVITDAPRPPQYMAGAALQVEYDSNMLVFAGGLNNFETIYMARKGLFPGDVLIRHHPHGLATYSKGLGVLDNSPDTVTFLRKCGVVFTVNSSVAFECLLQGKPVRILGDSPAASLSEEKMTRLSPQERLCSLNYLFLCYLVPAQFLYDVEYYRWRLSQPPMREIYKRHFEALRQLQAPSAPPVAPVCRAFELKALKAALKAQPKDLGLWVKLGMLFRETNLLADSDAALEEALRLDPRNELALIEAGLTRLQQQRLFEALACFERAEAVNPRSLRAVLFTAQGEEDSGDLVAARLDYLRALKLDPGNALASERIAVLDGHNSFAGLL